jgi:RNA polymerase sigma-70 factor (ECF subfamily)
LTGRQRLESQVERVARASYGRLLALLAAPTGDIPLAEDALADAFEQALRTWPELDVPANPEGWLLTVARNRLRDVYKSSAHRTSTPLGDLEPSMFDDLDFDAIPDKRLELLFVCAHPAIDARVRTPLMLQTVLGFDAAQIASVFAIPPSAMAQRLVRAKRRIRDARIPFAVPTRQDMPSRLPAVLEAVYGAYAIDWTPVAGSTAQDSLSGEALYLAATLAELLGNEPEAFGLSALIALSSSRAAARMVDGRYVPLDEQDTTRWDAELIAQGNSWLRRAHSLGRIGRFQLEAAIQSVHCGRASRGSVPKPVEGRDLLTLRKLYEALVAMAPSLGARVSLSAVIGQLDGPDAGLAALDAIDDLTAQHFQPAWATRAHLLASAGRPGEAAVAYERAISLAADPALRAFLLEQATRVNPEGPHARRISES